MAKLSSIDRTGQGVIMRWKQTAFEPSNEQIIFHLENFSDGLPCLDAWLAGQLSEPKHMHGNIGMRFQKYLERAQPMTVPRLDAWLDRMRGSQLTQQALLELPLDSFSQSDLRHFYMTGLNSFSTAFSRTCSHQSKPNTFFFSNDSNGAMA